ncbi:transcriptional initiation protein Tat [Bradyrhizobium sp. MOS001]|uniref:thiosulfate dehydrogenase n=1 Tax=unclassified Bradyrhizobium TaxID=2631580 RepID=UPI0010756EF5|nr:transcriptional initiation protein Tat [Bradyrhizobium sp. MOS001]TFW55882.1 transcriptional initiation protein Tat [Bradyrhizobium sp. MOS001]
MNSIVASASRRTALLVFSQAAMFLGAPSTATAAEQESSEHVLSGIKLLHLSKALADSPCRRGFKSVPFILTSPEPWDHEAADLLLSYKYHALQVWESTDLAAPWINLMREAINGQVFSLGNVDFLAVAAVHGNAHAALFNQAAWEKYKLAKVGGGQGDFNSFIVEKPGASPRDDLQDLTGFYGPQNSNIVSLQRRGAVFLGCHDSIHAIARYLHQSGEFSDVSPDAIAADLTKNLIPGVVLVPSVVAFLVELQHAGFTYSKAS